MIRHTKVVFISQSRDAIVDQVCVSSQRRFQGVAYCILKYPYNIRTLKKKKIKRKTIVSHTLIRLYHTIYV